jgi:hypothetical protein
MSKIYDSGNNNTNNSSKNTFIDGAGNIPPSTPDGIQVLIRNLNHQVIANSQHVAANNKNMSELAKYIKENNDLLIASHNYMKKHAETRHTIIEKLFSDLHLKLDNQFSQIDKKLEEHSTILQNIVSKMQSSHHQASYEFPPMNFDGYDSNEGSEMNVEQKHQRQQQQRPATPKPPTSLRVLSFDDEDDKYDEDDVQDHPVFSFLSSINNLIEFDKQQNQPEQQQIFFSDTTIFVNGQPVVDEVVVAKGIQIEEIKEEEHGEKEKESQSNNTNTLVEENNPPQ